VLLFLVYEEQSLDKKSYDDRCALRRSQCPDLLRRITQAMDDPRDSNRAATIVALINNHQASISLPVLGDNTQVPLPTADVQPPSLPDYHGFPFDIMDSGGSSFPPITNPRDLQQQEPETDSGFYSNSSVRIERNSTPLAPQQPEYSSSSASLMISNIIVDQVFQALDSVPTTGEAHLETGQASDIADDFDMEAFLALWGPNTADGSGPSILPE
jgi:hypothetical protein